ncbi:hypothetical protein B0T26DRAFT_91945 [Lasiosphaeria miniovina]|uniref:Uncharacterized protein n=1 Tax=Lasiosphaeria miniovina TaxID=1954250 RepID=A0AA40BIV4_9PEZI|nr:uncharacterized protein B0T26DRAFT_91945 [Lasiosphaeria miniovina]KAK0735017.1 hypothetical protein B0T26DRAFT_91945 [Lasiosphaeria miniovina]
MGRDLRLGLGFFLLFFLTGGTQYRCLWDLPCCCCLFSLVWRKILSISLLSLTKLYKLRIDFPACDVHVPSEIRLTEFGWMILPPNVT